MAVTIYPDAQPWSTVLSSFVSGAVDPDSFPMEIYVKGDTISLNVGPKVFTVKIAPGYLGRRPIIIALSIEPTLVRIGFVSASAYVRETTHQKMNNAGLKLYLGRNNDAGNMRMATMDVLDLGLDTTWTGKDRFWTVINQLDAAYGVTK